jgi:hypothetical protein
MQVVDKLHISKKPVFTNDVGLPEQSRRRPLVQNVNPRNRATRCYCEKSTQNVAQTIIWNKTLMKNKRYKFLGCFIKILKIPAVLSKQ